MKICGGWNDGWCLKYKIYTNIKSCAEDDKDGDFGQFGEGTSVNEAEDVICDIEERSFTAVMG